jgi:hypothetical protein
MCAGGDVKENHLVSALFIIPHRQVDWIAHVAQFTRLCFAELDPAGNPARMNVQAWYDTFRHHRSHRKAF